MTAEATKTPPTRAQQAAARRRAEALKKQALAELEAELKRWSPEEVVAKELLPYKSVRSLKEKCYRREVHCHLDGTGITFTADDIRAENARNAVTPAA